MGKIVHAIISGVTIIFSTLFSASSPVLINSPIPPSVIIVPSITPTPTPTRYRIVKCKIEKYPYEVRCQFGIPENGGNINTTFAGYMLGARVCEASLAGYYEGGEGGKIAGDINGICDILLKKLEVTGKLEGKVYPTKNYLEATITGNVGEHKLQEYFWSSFCGTEYK